MMRISPIPILSVFAVLLLSFSITAIASAVPSLPEQSHANWAVDRIDFVHYAKGNGAAKQSSGGCYKLMGVKWDTLNVPYAINPANAQGLGEAFVTGAISTGAETWDANTSQELFNNAYTTDYSAHYNTTRDYVNAIDFGTMSDNNVIAVTSVWYNRFTRKIVEFDMRLNTYYNWGDATLNASKMDLQNIATHELGHAVGMDDIYTTTCSYVTMYGYSNVGDTAKRSLEQPDITGLQKMYGA